MKKMIVPASKCIPGMITANPVIDLKTGLTIIAANQELTPKHIQDILKFLHTDIWVYLDSSSKVWGITQETIQDYEEYSDKLLSIITDLDSNNLHAISDLEALSQSLPLDFSSNYKVIGCTNLIEQLDYNTYNHSLNVAFIALLICRWCHFDEDFTNCAIQAGLLHDIGLINLSFNPFTTLKPWTEEQTKEYHKHPVYSHNIVHKIKDLDPMIGKAILAHHECCDGSGFPLHITSPYISQLGKILAIADRYELMKKYPHIFSIVKTLLVDQITQFDPYLLLTFCNNIVNYYIGTYAVLSNGLIGEVVFIDPHCIYRPIIRVNDQFISLYENPSIEIVSLQ